MKYIFSFLTAAILIAGCKSDPGSPKGTVTGFIETMKKGDVEGAKKFITQGDIAALATFESYAKSWGSGDESMIEKMKKEFVEKSRNTSYSIKDEKVEGDKATVNVEFKQNDKTTTQPFQLVNENGWKISLMTMGLGMHGFGGDANPGNINMSGDSLQKALEHLKDIRIDTNKLKEGLEKIKKFQENNPENSKKIDEAIKKLEEAQKTNH